MVEYGHDCQFARTLKRRGRKVPRSQPSLDDDETPLMSAQSDKAGSVVDKQTSEDGHLPASHNGQQRILQYHHDGHHTYSFPDALLNYTSSDHWASLDSGASVPALRARDLEPRISFENNVQQAFSSPMHV